MPIEYKNHQGIKNSSLEVSYTGFAIRKEFNKVHSITEYVSGNPIGVITFRPTQIPVVFSVQYGNYNEERYNHGGISSIYITNQDCRLYGEYRKYLSNGSLDVVKYFNNNHEVTAEIMDFVQFKGSEKEFNEYKFAEDEYFNLCLRYGSYFKFTSEYNYSPKYFDEIVLYCLQ